jgi:hypothetical protein
MAKIKRGYTRKEPSIPKASPHKDIPVLKDKAPDRPRKSPRGSKYRQSKSSGLAAFHSSERALARENKADTGRSKSRTGWGRFFRGGGGSDSPGYVQPTGSKSLKGKRIPKLQ